MSINYTAVNRVEFERLENLTNQFLNEYSLNAKGSENQRPPLDVKFNGPTMIIKPIPSYEIKEVRRREEGEFRDGNKTREDINSSIIRSSPSHTEVRMPECIIKVLYRN